MAKFERPVEKPKLQFLHEMRPDLKPGDPIGERLGVFAETDGGRNPHMPPENAILRKEPVFEEYVEELKSFMLIKREKGILEARVQTPGRGGLVWGTPAHHAIHYFWEHAGKDRDNEVIIFGGNGKDFFETIGPVEHPDYRDITKQPRNMPDLEEKAYNWMLYEHQYFDGTNDVEFQVDAEQPTIGVWNGGGFHSDLWLYTDITLATADAWTTEMHFRINMVPGDGVQLIWRNLMGHKRFAYAELTGEIITAKKALQYGMINEICDDTEACYKRAWEIAELIMHSGTHLTRRLTTQIIRRPWKEMVASYGRADFATEMWNTLSEDSPHSSVYWACACAEAKANMEAEKNGKIIRPRLGAFVEEDPML